MHDLYHVIRCYCCPDGKGWDTDHRQELEPGGLGVSLKQALEFVEEASLFRASLPLYHVVILSPEFILVSAMYIITLILKGGQQKKNNNK